MGEVSHGHWEPVAQAVEAPSAMDGMAVCRRVERLFPFSSLFGAAAVAIDLLLYSSLYFGGAGGVGDPRVARRHTAHTVAQTHLRHACRSKLSYILTSTGAPTRHHKAQSTI